MDLFPTAGPRILVDDDEGGIRYWADAVDAATAAAWFEALRAGAHWEMQHRPMHGRVVAVPRLLASYRLDALPSSLPLADMHRAVQRRVPAPYTAVGLNLYRDGRDSVAMHHDKLHTLVPGQPIALLSLGDARRMSIRAKDGRGKAIAIELAPGSVLAMSHASQLTHAHGIAKTTRPVGPRISAVFRARPAAKMAAGLYGTHWQGPLGA
ncbi:alpha-ketoglutarate-dependent dioxygenase AlkB [Luteimonas sp. FCS-9]|uniref:alpha-ketoglutarate-dependent dioxygenase AlkB n=1 Tax=Luteimonas sp. FCS-9 TaxID=1547516 RepID=UPI00063EAE28|nr:alpha-ketoglutarate-dependent dioxygenase AlkB [Luteimonas sp. FCS-9]KLJ00288.1 DNA-3-methyladenine glycosylase [Luteimonas sp. FCS-9]